MARRKKPRDETSPAAVRLAQQRRGALDYAAREAEKIANILAVYSFGEPATQTAQDLAGLLADCKIQSKPVVRGSRTG